MTIATQDAESAQKEWLHLLQGLLNEVSRWCEARGWSVSLNEKPVSESSLGSYSVPLLQIRSSTGTVVYVEPVARRVAGGDGLVDIYAWPSLRRFLLVRQNGSWAIRTDSGVPLPWKWSEQTFFEVVEALTAIA